MTSPQSQYQLLNKANWLELDKEISFLSKEKQSQLSYCTNDSDRFLLFSYADSFEKICTCHQRLNNGYYYNQRCNTLFCSRCAAAKEAQTLKRHPYMNEVYQFSTIGHMESFTANVKELNFFFRKVYAALKKSKLKYKFFCEISIVSLYPILLMKPHVHILSTNGDASQIKLKGAKYTLWTDPNLCDTNLDYEKAINYCTKPINLTTPYAKAVIGSRSAINKNMASFLQFMECFHSGRDVKVDKYTWTGSSNARGFYGGSIVEEPFIEIPEEDMPPVGEPKPPIKRKNSKIKYPIGQSLDGSLLYDEASIDLEAASYLSDT